MSEKNEITRWNPFQELDQLQDRMRSLFMKSGNGGSALIAGSEFADWSPAVDIEEDEKEYTITADLPDVDRDHVKVTSNDGYLTITGEREHEKEEKDKNKDETWTEGEVPQ